MNELRTGLRGEANQRFSGGFQDATGFDTVGANLNTSDGAIDLCSDFLQVRKESPRRPVVRVTHIVSRHRFLAADFTYTCHTRLLQIQMIEID